MKSPAREQFVAALREAVAKGALVKLTLGKATGADKTLVNLFVRPVSLKSGQKLAFVWRHKTRDITKNHEPEEALGLIDGLIGTDFLDAHLFTTSNSVQLETGRGEPRIHTKALPRSPAAETGNDRKKSRPIDPATPWLRSLGVTDPSGRPLAPMTDKFRQIEKFAEILTHLLGESDLAAKNQVSLFDMGSGKGYLTFAAAELLGAKGKVCGIEARPDLVDLCSRVAAENGLSDHLSFTEGTISSVAIDACDVLIALHACDTATDDAIAKGVSAGAQLIIVAPCCQKELRPQIVAPPVLADALRHGIFEERQAEFVTDAMRAQLLEWSGYRTRVFEFISTEHTAKNTMIAAVKVAASRERGDGKEVRDLAAFYGVTHQALATHLHFDLR
jgi:precorrin-6B methylase 2